MLESCKALAAEGFRLTVLPVEPNGLVDLARLAAALSDDTLLVSIMAANNEIGVIQPLAEIGELCRERGAYFHTDAAQAAGKIPLDVEDDGDRSHEHFRPQALRAQGGRRALRAAAGRACASPRS